MAPLPVQPSRPDHLFKPGPDPRRTGRPKGSRHKLATAFFNDTYALWEEQGDAILRRAAFENPAAFAQMIAKLMPQKLEITTPTEGMSDERFEELLALAERMAKLQHTQATDHLLGKASSVTIEGAVEVIGEGAGSPQGRVACGGVIDVIPLTPPQPDRPDDRLADEPNIPVLQIPMTGDEVGNPTTPEAGPAEPTGPERITCLPPEDGEEDIDPLSLFA